MHPKRNRWLSAPAKTYKKFASRTRIARVVARPVICRASPASREQPVVGVAGKGVPLIRVPHRDCHNWWPRRGLAGASPRTLPVIPWLQRPPAPVDVSPLRIRAPVSGPTGLMPASQSRRTAGRGSRGRAPPLAQTYLRSNIGGTGFDGVNEVRHGGTDMARRRFVPGSCQGPTSVDDVSGVESIAGCVRGDARRWRRAGYSVGGAGQH